MRKIILTLAVVMTTSFAACAQNKKENNMQTDNKTQAPRIVNTFIESHNLKGKILVPFATSGDSGITGSVKELRKSYPDLKWQEGKLLNGTSSDGSMSERQLISTLTRSGIYCIFVCNTCTYKIYPQKTCTVQKL